MVDKHHAKPFPFLQLPKELRTEILEYADLIDPRFDHPRHKAIWILGKRQYSISSSPEWGPDGKSKACRNNAFFSSKISTDVLLVNRQVHDEALEILLCYNRIALANGHDKNLECLKALPLHIRRRLRRLHLRFNNERDFEQDEDFFCCVIKNPEGWDRLVSWIAENLTLSILHLSIDLGEHYRDVTYASSIDTAMFIRAYRRICRPLPRLHGLKDCFVFLPRRFRMEAEMEKAAIGDPNYNSIEHNKVPPISRNPRLPHAWPPRTASSGLMSAHVWRMYDYGEDPDQRRPTTDIIEERMKVCLHKEWWADMPPPTLPPLPGEYLTN